MKLERRRGRMLRCSAALAVLAAVSATAALPQPDAASARPPSALFSRGLERQMDSSPAKPTIVGRARLTARTVRLTIATDAFEGPVPVEVTLPRGYRSHPRRRWPVTYYLHGANHDETTFRSYDGEAATASFPSIIVSPRGDAGFWSDWYNAGAGGSPRYETFVIRQLIPLIDATYRTMADRASRALMGESMGGFGTMKLAAKHPGLFAAAASLSGGLDSNLPLGAAVITAAPLLQGRAPNSIFGDRLTQQIRWRGENPVDLALNLRHVDLQLFTGNGTYVPSHGENLAEASAGCILEGAIVRPTSLSMHNRLTALGIPHRWVPLAWGCHGAALFEQEIRHAVIRLERVFDHPASRPVTFDYRSIAPAFSVWGWHVRTDPRRASEFVTLRGVGRAGVRVAGSGSTVIRTARIFGAHRRVRITIGSRSFVVRATNEGRLTFTVRLGPPHTRQAYTLGADATVRSVRVRFEPT